eukprot:256903_1
MCIANDKEITEYVLNSHKFCNCCNYKAVYIFLLAFGFCGVIVAWLFASGSVVAIVWDAGYTLLCIIATIVFCTYNYIPMVCLIIAYSLDAIIGLALIWYYRKSK